MKKVGAFLAILAAVALAGCGTSRLMVIQPISGHPEPIKTIQVNEFKSRVTIPEEAVNQIRLALMRGLEKKRFIASKEGGALILDVSVVSFDIGDRFARWFWGGIGSVGQGVVSLETTYIDPANGEAVGKINTEGTISVGFFGGSMDTAYNNAVEKIIEYTAEHFSNSQ